MFSKRFTLCLVLVVILSQAGCQFRGAPKATPTARLAATAENTTLPPTTSPSLFPTKVPELKPSAAPLPTQATIPACQNTTSSAGPALATSNPSSAFQSSPVGGGLKIVGQIGGPTRAVAAAQGYALVGVGARLVVLGTTIAEAVCERGATQTFEAPVRAVAIAESTAFVAAGEAGLYIVNVTDPAQPVVIGRYDSPGYAEGVTVIGNVAYLADGPYGLRLIDITDPAQPGEISAVYELNYAFDVAVDTGHAYVAAAGAGVLVADISDVKEPSEASTYDTQGYAYGVALSGSTLFVANGWEGVQVVDISQPGKPTAMASFDVAGWAMDVATQGDMLYIAAAAGGLRIWDVSDRSQPVEVGSYRAANGHAAQVALYDDIVYLADIQNGLHIMDVSSPAEPRYTGLYSPLGYAQAVAVAGQYAYVSARNYGFRVVDLANPALPREVGSTLQGATLASVALSSQAAYVTTSPSGTSNRSPGWIPINISDPLHPQPGPEQSFPGMPRGVDLQGTVAYYPVEWGLLLLDVSDPHALRQLSFLETATDIFGEASATGISVAEGIAYLAVANAGLYTVDVSNPKQPIRLGVFNEPAGLAEGEKNPSAVKIGDVVAAPPYAYVIDISMLRVLDISNPKQPKAIGQLPLTAGTFNTLSQQQLMAIDGHRLFLAAGKAGLLEIDVSDPTKPRLAGELRLPGDASWIDLDGEYIYVADGEGGLFIVDSSQELSSTLLPSTAWQAPSAISHVNTAPARFSPLASSNTWNAGLQHPQERLRADQRVTLQSAGDAIVVTSAADSGPGTLRQALEQAREGDTITFDAAVFPPDAPVAIRLQSELPGLSIGGVTLNASNAGVIIDGSDTSPGTSGLNIPSNNNVVMGLQIINFPANGVSLGGSNNTIGGDASRGSGPLGKGNLISGNKEIGIHICCGENAAQNRIVGNYIGTDTTGMKPFGNGSFGIQFSGVRNSIGGLQPGERNVIAASGAIDIYAKAASGNVITGNYIGVDALGQNLLTPDSATSVELSVSTDSTTIMQNVIAGSVTFVDAGSSYNELIGNYIGTDASGSISISERAMVSVFTPFNRIGGTQPGEGNVINGSVRIAGVSDVVVVGNFIGVDASGKKLLPLNQDSRINFEAGANHNFVGGMSSAERNVLAGGEGETIISIGEASTSNFILGNSLGTDLSGSKVFPGGAKMGIRVDMAEHNVIQGNLITGCQAWGVGLGFQWDRPVANFNVLRANTIIQNPNTGIAIGGGQGNLMIANTVMENSQNASDAGSDNHWDDGRAGNYWGDYQGGDRDGDGIGDILYEVAPNGVDHFPLVKPIPSKYSPN